MSLDSAVPKYSRPEPPAGSEMKPLAIAGGMFLAWVPNTIEVCPEPGDPDPLEHKVVLHVDVEDGRLVCTRCEVVSLPGGPSVTADALRRVPIGRYLRESVPNMNLVVEVDPDRENATRLFVAPPRDFAATGMSDDVLREVARLYHWAVATADAPLGLLEREYGIPHGKASRWIATARRRGFIKVDDDGR